MENGRQERRRKIMSGGVDRMAIITGRRTHSLDPADLPSPSLNEPFPRSAGGDVDVPYTPTRQEMFKESDNGIPPPINIRRVQSSSSIVMSPRINPNINNTNPDHTKSTNRRPSNCIHFLSPKEINSSIISSENTRVICSTMVAILVVISNANVPHSVVKSKSLISYRPLYVVLLTDVLIVAARLALYSHAREEAVAEEKKVDECNFGGAIKLLELGLVLHQITRALFIDCSFYLVIVVCGLSFL